MISRIRDSVFTRIFWGLIGIYLLNISVDIADPSPEFIDEDLSFNDQESIIEIIVEKILGFEDAIDEYDDVDSKDQSKKSNVKIDLIAHFEIYPDNSQSEFGTKKQVHPDVTTNLISGFFQPDPLPPEV